MDNTCIVCGKRFRAKTWNQTTCSDECKQKRQYECWLKHKQKKEEQYKAKEEKAKAARQAKRKLTAAKSNVTVQRGDPKWVKDYAKGNRLTQISMLARALTDYNITNISYGVLSTKWDTKQYYSWESTVIGLKRKEKTNDKQHIKDIQAAAEEGTFKSKNRPYHI